jgi:trehalose-6-phosphate synthase
MYGANMKVIRDGLYAHLEGIEHDTEEFNSLLQKVWRKILKRETSSWQKTLMGSLSNNLLKNTKG